MQVDIKPMSVNKAWQGRRFKTPEYKKWRQLAVMMLPILDVPKDKKLKINLIFGFSNKNEDIDNSIKTFLDALQDKYNFNDSKVYELKVKKEIVKKGKEFINFKIEEI